MNHPKHILLCRTDSIGDVMVTLPLAAWIKQHWPAVTISFAGRSYTRAVIEACIHVDHFVNADEILSMPNEQAIAHLKRLQVDAALFAFPDPAWMKMVAQSGVLMRIATAKRWASWKYATHRVWFSRKNSDLHEAQLNAHLLRPLGLPQVPSMAQILKCVQLTPQVGLPASFALPPQPFVILHPKSKGSAVEWGISAFRRLAEQLVASGYSVVITGTSAEGEAIRKEWDMRMQNVLDATGELTLDELIALIAQANALVAASTGPLHIAAALGIRAVGLFTPKRPMHSGRWAPLGPQVSVLVASHHPQAGEQLDISSADVLRCLL